jgi:ribosomal protein S19
VELIFAQKTYAPTDLITVGITCSDKFILPDSITLSFTSYDGSSHTQVITVEENTMETCGEFRDVQCIGSTKVKAVGLQSNVCDIVFLPDIPYQFVSVLPTVTNEEQVENQRIQSYEITFKIYKCIKLSKLDLRLISPPTDSYKDKMQIYETLASCLKISDYHVKALSDNQYMVTVTLVPKVNKLPDGGFVSILVGIDSIYLSTIQSFCGKYFSLKNMFNY